jgi:uncharacterized protein (DUF885 family)
MKIYDNYFDEYITLTPSLYDCLNLSDYKHLKKSMENPLSLDHITKQKELHNKYLTILSKKKRPNIYDKTLMYICNDVLESYKYNFELTPINHQENILYYILEMASGEGIYTFNKKQDYADFITKMCNFSEIVDSIIYNMKKGIVLKYTLPKILVEKLISQIKELLTNKSYLNKSINYKLNFDFNAKCASIFVPPLNKLLDFLKSEYLSKSRSSIGMVGLPNGIREYKYLVKSSTTLKDITIDNIHKYGLQEVKRISEDMNKIKDKLEFKGTLKEFNTFLGKRNDLNFKSKNDLLEHYKTELKSINNTIMKTQFHSNVKGKCQIIPVPKFNENYSAEAYYMGGDLDKTRQGKFYINLKNYKENNKIEIESLTLHEANPGHHYQITYVNESADIPLFLKCYPNDAYQEGWALYCENLGKYKTYESYYGKLVLEMIRALRLVVDTAIHYYGWSYTKTFNYYKRYSFDSDSKIHDQLLRYIALPSQALSYKIGERIILDLKKQFKTDFNNPDKSSKSSKEFHQKILEHGPLPLEILKELF